MGHAKLKTDPDVGGSFAEALAPGATLPLGRYPRGGYRVAVGALLTLTDLPALATKTRNARM